MYYSTKTYGHECGFSAAFRQWRATSHCALIHGYALSIRITFAARTLDARNWVVDFGGMGELKAELAALFDHKTLVAADDPEWHKFKALEQAGVIEMVTVSNTGCEAFAKAAFDRATIWLDRVERTGRVRVAAVEVSEHGANSATYTGEPK